MRNVTCLILLNLLFACSNERKPLEIRPIMAEDVRMGSDGHWKRKDYPIPDSYYFKNFKDDKQCLREFLQYVKDEAAIDVEKHELPRSTRFYKKNKGAYFEEGVGYVDQKCYYAYFANSISAHFQWFSTPSKYEIWLLYIDEFPERCDYKYSVVRKGKAAVVYFDYEEFDTDTWQKFINVAFYDRERLWREDYKKYDLERDNLVLAWRHWSAPTRYSLLNLHTKEIECVIEYPLADNYEAFTMEIH